MGEPVNGCAVDGCDRTHWARGWCQMHYKRWWRTGDPSAFRPRSRAEYQTQWFCVCVDPVTDGLGECQTCHRKPRALMNV